MSRLRGRRLRERVTPVALWAPGSTFVGFYVPSLDAAQAALVDHGTPVLMEHQTMPWGCRILVEDPDGRHIEVNQTHHCEEYLHLLLFPWI
ncbi:MAG: hypothetical protein L0H31_07450 [Nocardioidaceae bacterium]|nr:hypothetical protein [Nocardioidaceae bacterium]